jgi:acetyl/propionyl-CoA carboxylase alpha subunit
MIKAAAGGGGKGMRLADNAETLPDALAAARREAQQAFGNDALMLEKALQQPRHIEVQIIADTHGNIIALGERECSIQRRHQKIIEEAPAAGLDAELRYSIHQTAVNIARQLNYTNAGTVEFLLDSEKNFYFIEMNTRLQVEHPVTEAVYAVDIVRWQLEIAQGTSLRELLPPFVNPDTFDFQPDGHAVEARIYAEDPASEFLPVTGDILHWEAPSGVRVDSGVRSGDSVTTHYDPMLAKVIAHGSNRNDALRRLDYALSQLQFLGMRNNIAFLRQVLMHPDHINGEIHTQFIETHPDLLQTDNPPPVVVLAAAALSKRGTGVHWRNNPNQPKTHTFTHNKTDYTLQISQHRDATLTLHLNDSPHRLELNAITDSTMTLTIDGHRQTVTIISADHTNYWLHSSTAANGGTWHLQWQSPLPLPGAIADVRGSLHAPMPGQVIQVLVESGQTVEAGTTLMILEAMKMEHRITAPESGTIEQLHYTEGDTVQADEVLLTLSSDSDEQV